MKTNLTETIVGKIEYKILSGEYKVKEKLPTLREMVNIYGVSRSVINAAMVELSEKGYIKIVPTKWSEVADWKKDGTLAVLNGLLEYNLLNKNDIKTLLESRRLIETECARLAAFNRSIDDINELKALLLEEEKKIDIKKRVDLDLFFHHQISLASKNVVYPLILKSLEKNSHKLESVFYSDDSVVPFVVEHHHALIEAIDNKNGELSAKIMEELLDHGEKNLAIFLSKEEKA